MNRVAFLPTIGADPFVTLAFMDNYDKVWGNEVGRLFFLQNSLINNEIREFTKDRVERSSNTVFINHPNSMQHGYALREMFDKSTEEYILLVEDDLHILERGIIDNHFEYVERDRYDFIGQPRGFCNHSLMEKVKQVYNLPFNLYRNGTNYWPCAAFGKRSDYLKTDLNFGVKGFEQGEYIELLDWVAPETIRCDTFVWMSVQLHSLRIRMLNMPELLREGTIGAPWIHFGSLADINHSYMTNDDDILLPFVGKSHPTRLPMDMIKFPDALAIRETERKMGIMTLFMERYWDDLASMPQYREDYKNAIEKLTTRFFDQGRVDAWKAHYKGALKWQTWQ